MGSPQPSEGVGGVGVLEGRFDAHAIDDSALKTLKTLAIRRAIRRRSRPDGCSIRIRATADPGDDAPGIEELIVLVHGRSSPPRGR